MDVLTQCLLGAALSQSIAKKEETRLATGVGFFAGLIADADIFIFSSSDPLLNIELHRHFSHSIFFIPFGALIATLLLWPVLSRLSSIEMPSFKRLYLFCLLGYSLSGAIDACTSYGTHLFWPLIDDRIAWHLVSIIDPIFTGMLMIAVIRAWRNHRPRFAHIGLLLCCSYLLLSSFQLQRATEASENLAKSRQHTIEKLVVKPSFANILVWRSTYITNDTIYVDAIRAGFSGTKVYSGSSVPLFVPERDAVGIPKDSTLYGDILRFKKFSNGFIAMDPGRDDLLGDVRYSMSPIKIATLWGITLDKNKLDEHAHYGFYRNTSPEDRKLFLSMLQGQ